MLLEAAEQALASEKRPRPAGKISGEEATKLRASKAGSGWGGHGGGLRGGGLWRLVFVTLGLTDRRNIDLVQNRRNKKNANFPKKSHPQNPANPGHG
jgi:hypothetical protein